MFSIWSKSTAVSVMALGVLLTSVAPSQVQAREDWYETKGAHVGYGLVGGLIIGSALTSHHYRSREREHYYHGGPYRSCATPSYSSYSTTYYQPAPAPVYYQSAPVVYQQQPQPYVNYRRKTAFPFYSKTELEIIPQLAPVQPGRTQAINNANYANTMRGLSQTNSNVSGYSQQSQPETYQQQDQNQSSAVQEINPTSYNGGQKYAPVQNQVRPVIERQTTTISNRAGSAGVQHYSPAPAPVAAPQAPAPTQVQTVRNPAEAKPAAAPAQKPVKTVDPDLIFAAYSK